MATRAAAQKPDGSRREAVRRVRVWNRTLLRVSDTASTLASYQWVQTCTPLSCDPVARLASMYLNEMVLNRGSVNLQPR